MQPSISSAPLMLVVLHLVERRRGPSIETRQASRPVPSSQGDWPVIVSSLLSTVLCALSFLHWGWFAGTVVPAVANCVSSFCLSKRCLGVSLLMEVGESRGLGAEREKTRSTGCRYRTLPCELTRREMNSLTVR
jgi:hypothetical protein